MGTQWIHVDLHGKTASKLKKPKKADGSREQVFNASEIAAEQMRVEGHCDHVANPQPPQIIFGVDPRVVVEEALASFEAEPKVTVKTKSGPKQRGLRSDTPIVLAGVCSWPDNVEVMGSDAERQELYKRWIAESLKFLRKTYGKDLKAVVMHVDESHPHLHFTVATKRAVDVVKYHPAVSADSRTNAKKALVAFQDAYYVDVAVKVGLGRLGPRRQRLGPGEYKKQKAEREAFARELQRLEKRMRLVEEMEAEAGSILAQAMAKAAQVIADAVHQAKKEGEKMLEAAKAEANKLLQKSKDALAVLRAKDAEIEKTLGELREFADPKIVLNAERLVGKSAATRSGLKEDLKAFRKAQDACEGVEVGEDKEKPPGFS